MTLEQKTKMIEMRLDGYSIRTVGNEVGRSHQMVANYIKDIYPDGAFVDPSRVSVPVLTDNERAYLAKCIAECDGDLIKIGQEVGMSDMEVRKIMDYIAVRKPATCRSCIFPTLSTWMRRNMVTVKDMAKSLGVSLPTMSAILSGDHHITMKILSQIKDRTGLSYRDILEGHIAPINDEIEKELSILRANDKELTLDREEVAEPTVPFYGVNEDPQDQPAEWGETAFTMPPPKKSSR